MKEQLTKQVQNYTYTFAQWVASIDNIAPLLSLIGHDTESVLPEADQIIAAARTSADDAGAALAASRMHRALDHDAAGRSRRCHETPRRWRHDGAAERHRRRR